MIDYDNIPIGTKVYYYLNSIIMKGHIIGKSKDYDTFNHYIIDFDGYKTNSPKMMFDGYTEEIMGNKIKSNGPIYFNINKLKRNETINYTKDILNKFKHIFNILKN